MIQRIQTVYLLIGAMVCAVPFVIGFAPLDGGTPQWVFTMRSGLYILTAVLGVIAVVLFSRRNTQRSFIFWTEMVASLTFIVSAGSLILYGAEGVGVASIFGSPPAVLTIVVPAIALLFYRLARSGVDKDIKLIKSVDRLRD